MIKTVLGVALAIHSVKGLYYTIVDSKTLNTCNLLKHVYSVAAAGSVILNSDSISTAGMDVISIFRSSGVMEKINIYVKMPENASPIQLAETCEAHSAIIEQVSQLVGNVVMKRRPISTYKDQLVEEINNNAIILDANKMPTPFAKLAELYYNQGEVSPSVIMIADCVEPKLKEEMVSNATLNLFDFIHENLSPIVQDIAKKFESCENCVLDFIHKIAEICEIKLADIVTDEEVNEGIKMFINDHQKITDELLLIPRDEFPKTLGEFTERIMDVASSYNDESTGRFKTIGQNVFNLIEELYAELTEMSDESLLSEYNKFINKIGCDASPISLN